MFHEPLVSQSKYIGGNTWGMSAKGQSLIPNKYQQGHSRVWHKDSSMHLHDHIKNYSIASYNTSEVSIKPIEPHQRKLKPRLTQWQWYFENDLRRRHLKQ